LLRRSRNWRAIGRAPTAALAGEILTSNGHREGLGALDFFTTWKAVYADYSDKLQRAQIDNVE
jgi:hypothetical protein